MSGRIAKLTARYASVSGRPVKPTRRAWARLSQRQKAAVRRMMERVIEGR